MMLWRIEVGRRPGFPDPIADAAAAALRDAGIETPSVRRRDVFLIEAEWFAADADRAASELFADPVTDEVLVRPAGQPPDGPAVLVFRRPGVMDPVEASARKALCDLGLPAARIRTGSRFLIDGTWALEAVRRAFYRTIANEVVDEIVEDGPVASIALGHPCRFVLRIVPVREATDAELERISRDGQLALTLEEMRAVRDHFRREGREPTDVEIETIAQTWSEHCRHKTFTGEIRLGDRVIRNLLKATIMEATNQIAAPWCVSVFKDNAGVVEFDDELAIAFKVETHNHPSAIDPYGGAGTGIGGVIRDILGCGLGAQPIFSIDVFCVGPPDTAPESVPPGVIAPARLLRGVVAGVRDYGNRMGIPTIAGAVCFDSGYTANPLVYCGTAGILPRRFVSKAPRTGDRIVLVGGRTGRDGIHGATFSSLDRDERSEQVCATAVQIGNPIEQKKMLDALLRARDEGLYTCITDCGAGGLSSAVGEMAAELGAVVDLERVPLKYAGLSYCEIWISEAQERMVLAVPPERLDALLRICREEGVEATDIGEFTGDRRLRLRYEGTQVADLDLEFVHGGMPVARREAVLPRPRCEPDPPPEGLDPAAAILRVLRDPNIASKEWIIRQYDHEVQGRSAVKALVGAHHDGPSDAAVVRPRRDGWRGIAVGLGILPRYGAWDPYAMAASAVDEAVRNVLAVGARPDRIALLDNFSWGRPDDPEQLGALVAAADACRDVAIAYGTPFISGKDSLNNEFRWGGRRFPVPPTLLISAIGIVDDVRRCVTSDAKEPGNRLALVGVTDDEMGGSALWAAFGLDGGRAPRVVPERARPIFRALHAAITAGIVRACHDLSEGGLAIAAAEMAIGGALGIELDLRHAVRTPEAASDAVLLFSESNTRFLVEVRESDAKRFEMAMAQAPWAWVGKVTADPTFVVRGLSGSEIARIPVGNLRRAWKEPLAW